MTAIRKQLEEIVKQEKTKDVENRDGMVTAQFEKLIEELRLLKDSANADTVSFNFFLIYIYS